MSRYRLSPAARADLRKIWRFGASRWGRDQANRYASLLRLGFSRAADNPMAARAADEIRPGYRKLLVGSHILFFRAGPNDEIEIVRILHQRMNIPDVLGADRQ